jgi:prefoldin subunit 5
MPDEPTNSVMDGAAATLKDTVAALEAEEKRLAEALANAKARRKAVAKALEALTTEHKPRRRRRRTTTARAEAE